MAKTFLLFETAAGYALYQVENWEQIGHDTMMEQVMSSEERFKETVKFKAFQPFSTASEALENMRGVIDGEATTLLTAFLSQNLPKKNSDYALAVVDPSLGKNLSQSGFKVIYDTNILELVRGCRMYEIKRITKLISDGTFDMHNFQVGLGHNYSRSKLKFDVSRQDKPIINSISLLDSLTKNVNSFAMRVREWYGWHFPELCRIVNDNIKFCELVRVIKKKEEYNFDELDPIISIVGDDTIASSIVKASKYSIGQELTDSDMVNIETFADQVIKLDSMRTNISAYLNDKVAHVAPNLNTVIGPVLSSRLISHAGSLVNLAKVPASTIQILGAEKALFRALKSKSNTPKYGIIFQSTVIGKATNKHKGKAARYLANKCALAARLDQFCDIHTDIYGKKLSQMLAKRMEYLVGGKLPDRNINVMKEAHDEYTKLKRSITDVKTSAVDDKNKSQKKIKTSNKTTGQETAEPTASFAISSLIGKLGNIF